MYTIIVRMHENAGCKFCAARVSSYKGRHTHVDADSDGAAGVDGWIPCDLMIVEELSDAVKAMVK